ncbi:MAG: tetratricopeptide repeat protein [Luteolibacter sp.]|uniref:tetratricopeptide repeat protein n=1 Tax=Luteolibacter sp. TaxID=1962973 RepID=UPI003263A097
MVSEKPSVLMGRQPPVFAISCWALGLIAFSQLLIAGMALATRFEESQVVKEVIKVVNKPYVVRVPAAQPEPEPARATPSLTYRPTAVMAPAETQLLPAPTPVSTPKIADPRTERLVTEAKKARVAGDMGLAIMKLEEALNQSPDDPNVHYELGLVHELMGVFDTAAAHFEKVYQMGSDAGSLYELAAGKLKEGFTQPDDHGKVSLARIRVFQNPDKVDGEKVILTIPLQKAPGEEIDTGELKVVPYFFNRTSKGEIVQLEPQEESWVVYQWMSLPFDWANGEETLRITYTIPPQDQQTEHLFGERTYYGQVVSLLYKGEVLDVQAWPPSLAAKIPQAPAANPQLPEFQDALPNEFDPNLPLLPPLPIK